MRNSCEVQSSVDLQRSRQSSPRFLLVDIGRAQAIEHPPRGDRKRYPEQGHADQEQDEDDALPAGRVVHPLQRMTGQLLAGVGDLERFGLESIELGETSGAGVVERDRVGREEHDPGAKGIVIPGGQLPDLARLGDVQSGYIDLLEAVDFEE